MKDLQHTITYTLLALLTALLLASCEKVIEFDGEAQAPKLVLFSLATPGEPLSCTISHSAFFLSDEDLESRYTSGIKLSEGRVRVKVGSDIYTMRPEGEQNRAYRFSCDYVPKSGDVLSIEASFPGFDVVRSETYIPEPSPIELLSAEVRSDTESGNYCELTLRFKADPLPGRCYNLTPYMVMGEYEIPLLFESDDILFQDKTASFSDIFGSTTSNYFNDALIRGKEHTLTIRLREIDSDKIFVSLKTLTESLYYYALSREKALSDNGFLSERVTLYSNIEGGYGCFCAAAASGCEVLIKK